MEKLKQAIMANGRRNLKTLIKSNHREHFKGQDVAESSVMGEFERVMFDGLENERVGDYESSARVDIYNVEGVRVDVSFTFTGMDIMIYNCEEDEDYSDEFIHLDKLNEKESFIIEWHELDKNAGI